MERFFEFVDCRDSPYQCLICFAYIISNSFNCFPYIISNLVLKVIKDISFSDTVLCKLMLKKPDLMKKEKRLYVSLKYI